MSSVINDISSLNKILGLFIVIVSGESTTTERQTDNSKAIEGNETNALNETASLEEMGLDTSNKINITYLQISNETDDFVNNNVADESNYTRTTNHIGYLKPGVHLYLDTSRVTGNNSVKKRKAVVIINEEEPPVLRIKLKSKSKSNKDKEKKVNSLLYVEYGSDKKPVFDYMMRNLEDVSNFFNGFLNVEICLNYCQHAE